MSELKIQQLSMLGVIFFCPIIVWDIFDQNFSVTKQFFFQITTLVLFFIAYARHGNILFSCEHRFFFNCVFLMFLWGAISCFLSGDPLLTLPRYIFYLCGLFFLLLLRYHRICHKLIFHVWFVSCHVVVFIFYLQWLEILPLTNFLFYGSTLGNPNFVACLSGMFVLILFGYLSCSTSKLHRNLYLLSIFLFGSVVFLVAARGVFLGLISGFFTFFFCKKRLKTQFLFVFVVLIILSLFPVFKGKSLWTKENFGGYGATKERILIWKSASFVFLDNFWFGSGFEQWQTEAWRYKNRIIEKENMALRLKKSYFLYTHNDILQIFVELGIIGGALYCLVLFLMLYFVYLHLGQNSIQIGHFSALVVILVHSLLSFPLQMTFGFLGFLLNWYLACPAKKFSSRDTSSLYQRLPVLSVLFLFMCITFSWALGHVV